MLLELNRTESKSIFNAQINAEEIRVGYFANLHCICLGLSLVAFQLWRVLEQLVPEIVLNYFFKTGDRSMVPLTQKMQKNSKR